jgi:hypothetical protein
VNFHADNGVLVITVTNNDVAQSQALGQAISAISFTINGLSTPTAFSKESGEAEDLSGLSTGTIFNLLTGTPFSDSVAGNVDRHWGFSASGAAVTLAAAGNSAPGGAPIDMILPSSGTVGGGLKNSNHNPFEIGSTIFTLTLPGISSASVLTAANFTNVMVGFGTSPDNTFPATFQAAVPEPSTLAIAGLGAAAFLAYGARRRLRR